MQAHGGYPVPPHEDRSKLTFSRVCRNANSLASENIGPLVLISFVVAAIPRLAITIGTLLAISALSKGPAPIEWHYVLLLIISLTLYHLLPSYLLVGAIGEQVDDAMAGKPIRILPALGRAVFHLPAMAFSALAIGLTIYLSLPLLLIPAFALVPAMLLAPAASIIRKQGLRFGLAEAATLATGRRWGIILGVGAWFGAVSMIGQVTEYLLKTAITFGATPSFALLIAPILLLLSLEAVAGACVSIALYTEARKVAEYRPMLDRIADA
jgi:hypothetical protein